MLVLLLGLDALRGRRHAERLRERDDGADDRDRLLGWPLDAPCTKLRSILIDEKRVRAR